MTSTTPRLAATALLVGCSTLPAEWPPPDCRNAAVAPIGVDQPGSGGFTATEAAAEYVARAPRWTVQWSDADGDPVAPPREYQFTIDSVSHALNIDHASRETGEPGCWVGSAEGWLHIESAVSFRAAASLASLDGQWASSGPLVLHADAVRGPVATTDPIEPLPETHIEFIGGGAFDWPTTLSGSLAEVAAAEVTAGLGPYEWRLRNDGGADLTLEAVGEDDALVVYRCDAVDDCWTTSTSTP